MYHNKYQKLITYLNAITFCCAVTAKTNGDLGWLAVSLLGCNFLIALCMKD